MSDDRSTEDRLAALEYKADAPARARRRFFTDLLTKAEETPRKGLSTQEAAELDEREGKIRSALAALSDEPVRPVDPGTKKV